MRVRTLRPKQAARPHGRIDDSALAEGMFAAALGGRSAFGDDAVRLRAALDAAAAKLPRPVAGLLRKAGRDGSPIRFEARDSGRFKLSASIHAESARFLWVDLEFLGTRLTARLEPNEGTYVGAIVSVDADADAALRGLGLLAGNWARAADAAKAKILTNGWYDQPDRAAGFDSPAAA